MIVRSIVLIVAMIISTTVGYATVVDLTGSNDSGTINGAQFVFTPAAYRDWRDSTVLAAGEFPGRTGL